MVRNVIAPGTCLCLQVLKFLESQEMHITHYGLGLKGMQALLSALQVRNRGFVDLSHVHTIYDS
jgi:hypothetical protein